MIQNLWKQIVLVCGNGHEHEIVMNIIDGPSSLFYACPKYYPENRSEHERACPNRMNLVDYEKMVNFLSDKLEEALMNGEKLSLTNMKFNFQNKIQFRVVEHTDSCIKVEMLNKKALK